MAVTIKMLKGVFQTGNMAENKGPDLKGSGSLSEKA